MFYTKFFLSGKIHLINLSILNFKKKPKNLLVKSNFVQKKICNLKKIVINFCFGSKRNNNKVYSSAPR